MKKLKMVIPKGRIYANIIKLLNDSGFGVEVDERVYVPRINDPEIEAKIMKPQNIPRLVELGSHDVGFTGYDWIVETGANVIEIMDLQFDPVKIVAAIPEMLIKKDLNKQRIVVASEYEQIAAKYLEQKEYNYILLRTFGATEVFPPEDADMIIDNISTGRTLKEHNLQIVDTILESSTRFIANKEAVNDPGKNEKINDENDLSGSAGCAAAGDAGNECTQTKIRRDRQIFALYAISNRCPALRRAGLCCESSSEKT